MGGIWLDLTEPITSLAFEALQRAEQQNHDIMVEGFRRGAEQTPPGFNLKITEIVGDTVVSDETVLGPEAGFEDSDIHRVGRVSSSVESLLGIDDDRMETDISQLLQSQAPVVLGRNNLSSQAQPDDVRLTVCERLITKINHDLDVVGGVTGDLRPQLQIWKNVTSRRSGSAAASAQPSSYRRCYLFPGEPRGGPFCARHSDAARHPRRHAVLSQTVLSPSQPIVHGGWRRKPPTLGSSTVVPCLA